MYLTLVPAYGRDYKSKKEVITDWNAGKDFKVMDISCPFDGCYCSNQTPELKGKTLNIRYKRMEMICQIKVPK
jgi:hypothetical protein